MLFNVNYYAHINLHDFERAFGLFNLQKSLTSLRSNHEFSIFDTIPINSTGSTYIPEGLQKAYSILIDRYNLHPGQKFYWDIG